MGDGPLNGQSVLLLWQRGFLGASLATSGTKHICGIIVRHGKPFVALARLCSLLEPRHKFLHVSLCLDLHFLNQCFKPARLFQPLTSLPQSLFAPRLLRMVKEGVKPNTFTVDLLIRACNFKRCGNWERAMSAVAKLQELSIEVTDSLVDALLDVSCAAMHRANR